MEPGRHGTLNLLITRPRSFRPTISKLTDMEKSSFIIETDSSNYKILVVDDVVSNIMLLKALLKTKEYQVITAMNGQEALDKVAAEMPDLILLDVMMPGISGFEVAQRLQSSEQYHDIPIIFLTALNTHEDIVNGFKFGGNDFITKPFNKNELMIRIGHQISLIAAKRIILKQTEELRSIIIGRDKLYSVIAHDLRGPLGTIKMILNMIISSTGGKGGAMVSPEVFDMLSVANQTTEEVFTLLDNLLKWTKSQLGRLNVAPQRVNISDIVSDGIEIFKTTAEIKNISIVFDANGASCDIMADIDMIKTVLRNLLSNAIKFSNAGSEVVITVNVCDDDLAVVGVKDSGCGISDDDKNKLLCTDTHYSTFGTGNEEGSGLGLLLCDDFVRKNGGKLWFESKSGEGSTFFFSVPKI